MLKYFLGLFGQLGSVLMSVAKGSLTVLNNTFKSGFNMAMQYHKEAIAFSRTVGMSANQANAYTKVLTERAAKLGITYGISAEKVLELQKNISEATNRQLMLNDTQAEQFLQLNKLVGSSVTSRFTEEIMQGMGGQLETVQGAVSKAYATAAKSGLNAQKVSEKIAANLSMANRLSFRTGIDGLTRMAMQAEKVGMSLQSVEAVANNFLEIDDAISHAAQLQMLGGAAGAFGGNPMDMLYEANYDPEALQKRMTSMLGGYAQFDAKTGMASINGANQDFIRNIAKAMGIDTAEASRIAKKNAELRYKKSRVNTSAYKGMGLSQEQIDFLINKSNVKGGRVMFTDSKGKETELSANGKIDESVLKEMMQFEGKSDREIMEEQAKNLISINDMLDGIQTSVSGFIARHIQDYLPQIQEFLRKVGNKLTEVLPPIVDNLAKLAGKVLTKENIDKIGDGIVKAVDWIGKTYGFLSQHGEKVIAALVAIKLATLFRGGTPSGGVGGGSASMSWKQAKNAAKTSQRTSLRNGSSRFGAASKAAKNLTKNVKWLGRGVKGVAGVGTALSAWEIGSSIYDAHAKREEIENNKALTKVQKQQQKNEVTREEYKNVGEAGGALVGGIGGAKAGAAIGTMIAPGVGTVIGGLIGGLGGALLGGFIGNKAGGATASATAPSTVEKHAEGGIVGGSSYSGDKVLTRLNSGEMVLNFDQQNRLFNAIKNLSTPIIPSVNNITNNSNANSRHTIQTREVTIQNIGGNKVNTFANNSRVQPTSINNFGDYSLIDNRISNRVKGVTPVPTKIEAKPVGEKEYIYTPNRTETSTINGGTVTVKDFNININGTLKLDGGNSFKNINMNELLNNPQFVSAIKQMVQERINSDFNGGRLDSSPSVLRGLTTQVNTYGKKA